MIQIAICDDNRTFALWLRELVMKYLSNQEIEGNVKVYYSGKELLRDKREYDIYILDIEMKGINGIETGKQIRARSRSAVILFLTITSQYALEGYEVEPLRYLIKEEDEEQQMWQVQKVMKLAIDRVKREERAIIVQQKQGQRKIPLSEIVFIEVYNHICIIHTLDGRNYRISKALKEIEHEIKDGRFVRCHKSYIVNVQYIRVIEKNQIIMKHNETVMLGRSMVKKVKEAMMEYWR